MYPYDQIDYASNKFYAPNHLVIDIEFGKLAANGTHQYVPATHSWARFISRKNWPLTERASARIAYLAEEVRQRTIRIAMIQDILQNKDQWIDINQFAPPGITLFNHQQEAVNVILKVPRVPIIADCGLGKTLISLMLIKALKAQGLPCKTLVVCPKTLIDNAWKEDHAKLTPDLKFINLRRVKQPSKDYIEIPPDGDIYAINYDLVRQEKWHRALHAFGFDGIFFDESSRLKEHTTAQFKAARHIAQDVQRVHMLSGSPMPNGVIDLWSQMFLTDNGATLSNDYNFFREKTHRFIATKEKTSQGKQSYQQGFWRELKEAAVEVHKAIAPVILRYKKEECVDLPEKVFVRHYIELSPEQQKAYNDLKTQFITFLDEGGIVTTQSILVEMSKFLQITGGFVRDSADKETIHVFKQNPKLEALTELLEGIEARSDRPVLIWAWHRWEIDTISEKLNCAKVYGGMSDTEVNEALRRFKASEERYLVANAGSLGHGHTFVNGSYSIFYSNSFNYELRHQAVDRRHRIGQKETCYYYDLVARNTIDPVILNALQRKAALQEFVINPKLIGANHEGSD